MALCVRGDRSGRLSLGDSLDVVLSPATRSSAAERVGKKADPFRPEIGGGRQTGACLGGEIAPYARDVGLHFCACAHGSHLVFSLLLDSEILSAGARLQSRGCWALYMDSVRSFDSGQSLKRRDTTLLNQSRINSQPGEKEHNVSCIASHADILSTGHKGS